MSGHTPGPWSFSEQVGCPDHCFVAQVWDANGWPIAQLTSTSDAREATANARLIAAAPLMLDALKSMARTFDVLRAEMIAKKAIYANEQTVHEIDIRAAIRAAEGGE